jgi:hypothetical protein
MHQPRILRCMGHAMVVRQSESVAVNTARTNHPAVPRVAWFALAAVLACMAVSAPTSASTVAEPAAPAAAPADPATATALALQWSETQFAFATCDPERLGRLAAGVGAQVASLAHHLATRVGAEPQASAKLLQAIAAASIGRTAFEDAQQPGVELAADAAERLLLRDCLRNQPTWGALFDGLGIQASAVHRDVAASALTWNGRPIAARLYWQRGESGWVPELDDVLDRVWFAKVGSSAKYDPAWFDLAAVHDRAWRQAVLEADRPARVGFEQSFPIAAATAEQPSAADSANEAALIEGFTKAPAYTSTRSRNIAGAYADQLAAGNALDDLLAARGDADAALRVAVRLYSEADKAREAEAARLLTASAEGGHAAAMDLMAGFHVSGEGGFAVDCTAAAKWSLRAHELGYPDSGNNLAWVLATSPDPQCRNGELAIDLAEQSVAQARAVPLHESVIGARLDTLAAAYCEAGRIAEAIQAQIDAVAMEPITETEQRLQQYQTGTCWYGASGGGAGTATNPEPNPAKIPEQDRP